MDDIRETEENDPIVPEGVRNESSSDRSSEEIVLQTQQYRRWKRILSTKSKCVISNCELGQERKQPVQEPSFPSYPGIKSNFGNSEYSSPFEIFHISFGRSILKNLCVTKPTDLQHSK
jgi:hypothetical protein